MKFFSTVSNVVNSADLEALQQQQQLLQQQLQQQTQQQQLQQQNQLYEGFGETGRPVL